MQRVFDLRPAFLNAADADACFLSASFSPTLYAKMLRELHHC